MEPVPRDTDGADLCVSGTPSRADAAADLVVAAAAFHWFDQAQMLTEVVRVLRPSGAFVTSPTFSAASCAGALNARTGLSHVPPSFPAPVRRSHFNQEAVEVFGLRFVGRGSLAQEVPMTTEGLTEYLLTQSNATSAVDEGRITLTELRRWLLAEIGSRLPPVAPVMARFTGNVWCCGSAAVRLLVAVGAGAPHPDAFSGLV